jgi:hypothetical protein
VTRKSVCFCFSGACVGPDAALSVLVWRSEINNASRRWTWWSGNERSVHMVCRRRFLDHVDLLLHKCWKKRNDLCSTPKKRLKLKTRPRECRRARKSRPCISERLQRPFTLDSHYGGAWKNKLCAASQRISLRYTPWPSLIAIDSIHSF